MMTRIDPQESWEDYDSLSVELTVVDKVKAKMRKHGLSAREAASAIGMGNGTLSRIIRIGSVPNNHTTWLMNRWLDPKYSQTCGCSHCQLPTYERIKALEERVTALEKQIKLPAVVEIHPTIREMEQSGWTKVNHVDLISEKWTGKE